MNRAGPISPRKSALAIRVARHLSLDADEKKAFAETYMALKEGASVDVANETIVLASLFRPTQDGIIRDLNLSISEARPYSGTGSNFYVICFRFITPFRFQVSSRLK